MTLKEKLVEHKKIVIIVCVVIILAISGILVYSFTKSSDEGYSTSVKNGDKKAVYNNEITITKNDIYEYYLENYGENEVITSAINSIANKEITDQDQINAKLEELKKTYASYGSDGTLATYASSLGYSSEDAYIKEALEPEAKQQLLKTQYIEDHYKKLLKEYKVKYLKVITCDTESAALKIIKQATDDAAFTSLMNANSGSDAGMVTTENTSVDSKIIKKLSSFTKDGVYSSAIKTSEKKYAVVWVYNTDQSKVKDEIKEGLENIEDMTTKYESYYLNKYDFDVNESKIKDSIEKDNPTYFEE